MALALEGADFEIEQPAVSVASAVVLYLAAKGGESNYDRDPLELIRLSVRAQWHQHPPSDVAARLAARGVS